MVLQSQRLVGLVAVLAGSYAPTMVVSGWASVDRRRLLRSLIAVSGGGGVFGVAAGRNTANGACLPGDLSPDCIGVYKVPLDDTIKAMVSTREALKKYAPDLNYVPPIPAPKSFKDALEALLAQRRAADDIATVVAAGRLEEAGVKVLNLIPRITVSGRRLLVEPAPDEAPAAAAAASSSSSEDFIQDLRRQRLVRSLEDAEVAWNSVDIMMGQGLRGELGVSAVAQLQILSELRDATAALDELLSAVHER